MKHVDKHVSFSKLPHREEITKLLVSDFVFVALFVEQSLCRFAKNYSWGY